MGNNCKAQESAPEFRSPGNGLIQYIRMRACENPGGANEDKYGNAGRNVGQGGIKGASRDPVAIHQCQENHVLCVVVLVAPRSCGRGRKASGARMASLVGIGGRWESSGPGYATIAMNKEDCGVCRGLHVVDSCKDMSNSSGSIASCSRTINVEHEAAGCFNDSAYPGQPRLPRRERSLR